MWAAAETRFRLTDGDRATPLTDLFAEMARGAPRERAQLADSRSADGEKTIILWCCDLDNYDHGLRPADQVGPRYKLTRSQGPGQPTRTGSAG